jgi:hypothetical protein
MIDFNIKFYITITITDICLEAPIITKSFSQAPKTLLASSAKANSSLAI